MPSIFNAMPVGKVKRSMFGLNQISHFDCDAGQIIPLYNRFMVPNDVFSGTVQSSITVQPMVSKHLGKCDVNYYAFFTRARHLLGDEELDPDTNEPLFEPNEKLWETFITKGQKGDGKYKGQVVSLPKMAQNGSVIFNDNFVDRGDDGYLSVTTGKFVKGTVYFKKTVSGYVALIPDSDYSIGDDIATYISTSGNNVFVSLYRNEVVFDNGVYSLWQYLGYPANVMPDDIQFHGLFNRAYNMIYNQYFRNKELQPCVSIDNTAVLNACWKKDYFTTALPSIVRGSAPVIPVQINISDIARYLSISGTPAIDIETFFGSGSSGQVISRNRNQLISKTLPDSFEGPADMTSVDSSTLASGKTKYGKATFNIIGSQSIVGQDHELSTGFNVTSLRYAFSIQKWMEVNMQVGTDYHAWLLGHYGVSPSDSVLSHPIFLGACKSNLIFSEVYQTSSTDSSSPQGNLSGVGFGATNGKLFKYHAKEFGVLSIVMVIRPKASYSQGVSREALYESSLDFMSPELVRLSEQDVSTAEIYLKDTGNVNEDGTLKLFGYQGRYNELRSSYDKFAGGLVDEYDYWHSGRIFADEPVLNGSFVKCIPSKRIFAVPSRPGYVVSCRLGINAFRPLPRIARPGILG